MIRETFICAVLLVVVSGCRTLAPLPAVNLSEPGWTLRQGQAVWQSKQDAPEIAGELLFAVHSDGRTLLQFTKTPLPFVNVQTSGDSWQIEFVPQKRTFAGKGVPTPRLSWVHLARALAGARLHEPQHTGNVDAAAGHRPALRKPLQFDLTDQHAWKLENPKTGEVISGFLNP
jgi:hypothetical protein